MKKLSLFLAFILSTSVAHAQWTGSYEISDFSKLLTVHVNPYLMQDGAAVEARNLRANRTYGSLTKRTGMLSYGSIGSYKVTGVHRYYQADGDQYTVASGSTYLQADKNESKTFTVIRDELTEGRRWSFLTYKDLVIGCNGVDRCQKYDGHTQTTADTDGSRTDSILTSDLGAPFAEQNTGANLDASAWYSYKMMYTDGSVTYFSNAVSNPILTGSTVRDITLTSLPLGPAGTTIRYIYRTEGQATRAGLVGATFKLVGSISDNTTRTYNDTASDAALTTTWSETGKADVTPPIGKFLLLHKERLFIANNPDHNSDVYWSNPYRPDIFYAEDYEPFREDDGDEITFILPQSGVVAVGKTNTIMKFLTLSADSDDWSVLGPYTNIGCQAPYSAVNSPAGVIYLAKNGIYVFTGESSELISDSITTALRDVLWTSREEVAGIYYDNEYQMAYVSVESGGGVNNRVIVFDLTRKAYEIDDKNINVFEVFDSGTDEGTLYSGSSLDDGAILAHAESAGALVWKTKTDFETGTFDDTDVFGDEQDPYIEISWRKAFNDASLAGQGFADYPTATFQRPDTDGTWTSAVIEANATAYDKIYWNEELGSSGDIAFQVRSGASTAATLAATWATEYTLSSGSDISAEIPNTYLQIRATMNTLDILTSPRIVRSNNYNIKFVYSKEGVSAETAIPTVWKTGFMDFKVPQRKKRIWEIVVYYTGTSGTLNFNLVNSENNSNKSFDIDLSIDPTSSDTDFYFGDNISKYYVYQPELDGTVPIGEYFQYTIEENGVNQWQVSKIKTRYSIEEIH